VKIDISYKKALLDSLYKRYNRRELIAPDPLQFVYKYRRRSDREIVAFLSAALAYGRVEQIQKSLTNLFARMGASPYDFVIAFNKTRRQKLTSFKHRFTTGDDIADLLTLFKKVLRQYSSIEKFFLVGYDPNDANIIPALTSFCHSLCQMHAKNHDGRIGGISYLLADPSKRSPCKRLNLFLRWMVRSDDVDPGLWKSVDKSKLVIPVDVHMARLCKILQLYDQKTVSLTAATAITESFAQIESSDPVKYDFALSRIGIVENCTGHLHKRCEGCELYKICSLRFKTKKNK
jgi:uncharacterized protein (TIGR02757 family)